ncbi:hypothetical protein [Streptomyces sp. c-19]|uniref:hypothetical protein n=1 Tax=Streptomyces sp. c-19 TaxID=2789275 RepID=UPI00397ED78D
MSSHIKRNRRPRILGVVSGLALLIGGGFAAQAVADSGAKPAPAAPRADTAAGPSADSTPAAAPVPATKPTAAPAPAAEPTAAPVPAAPAVKPTAVAPAPAPAVPAATPAPVPAPAEDAPRVIAPGAGAGK